MESIVECDESKFYRAKYKRWATYVEDRDRADINTKCN